MTVICYRDGWLCADSLTLHNESIHSIEEVKIRRIGDCLVGMSGDVPSWRSIEEWFAIDQRSDRFKDFSFELMIIAPDCSIFVIDDRGIMDRINEPYWAIGCGEAGAMIAMDLGHSARQAVASAIRRIPGCGGKIHQLRLP